MRTITRSQAIQDLRRELLKLVDQENSLCQVAARRGLFCNGFGRWSTEELQRDVDAFSTGEPEPTRAEVERQANLRMLALQDVRAGRLPCDVGPGCRSPFCAGWDEFYEGELARFHREMLGADVRVVPDNLPELAR
jgi:hypothetical protein